MASCNALCISRPTTNAQHTWLRHDTPVASIAMLPHLRNYANASYRADRRDVIIELHQAGTYRPSRQLLRANSLILSLFIAISGSLVASRHAALANISAQIEYSQHASDGPEEASASRPRTRLSSPRINTATPFTAPWRQQQGATHQLPHGYHGLGY